MRFSRVGSFHVYILRCADGTYYTGFTPDLERRVDLHNKGKGAKFTRARLPVKLVWCRKFRYFRPAYRLERRIKKLTRGEKEKIIGKQRFILDKEVKADIITFCAVKRRKPSGIRPPGIPQLKSGR